MDDGNGDLSGSAARGPVPDDGRGATRLQHQPAGGFTPSLDVRETEKEYLVLLDLPGVKSEDVTIEVSDRVLTISGSRAPAQAGEPQLSERPYGSFARTLTLPQGVDDEKIAANYKDGVLELHVPKPAEQRPKKITIGGSTQTAISR